MMMMMMMMMVMMNLHFQLDSHIYPDLFMAIENDCVIIAKGSSDKLLPLYGNYK